MEEKIKTVDYRGFKINIYPDMDAQSPEDWMDDNFLLVHYHRDFQVERDKVITEDDIRAWYQGETIGQMKEYWLFPVAALIHSGVWLSLGQSFAADGGGWDTSHVGAVLAAKSEFPLQAKAFKAAEALIASWNDYLSGNIYGYMLEDGDGQEGGGCWGFYGDVDKSGVIEQARAEVDGQIADLTHEYIRKRKAQIKAGTPLSAREPLRLTI